MKTRRYQPNRRVQHTRETVIRRPRPLEDPGFDELDEWMVACPAADTAQPR
jgi:hypothetical protein